MIICNQTCLIDWINLINLYSPVFTKIVYVKQGATEKVGLRPLGIAESIFHALGIIFPESAANDNGVYFSLKKLKEEAGTFHYRGLRPIVVFPEGTKTNGNGILQIEEGLMEMIDQAALKEKLSIHAIRFDHDFTYFSPYNTTDSFGARNLFGCLCQLTTRYQNQLFFNIQDNLQKIEDKEERYDLIRRSLMIRRKEHYMKNLSWRDHQKFLEYWNSTQS